MTSAPEAGGAGPADLHQRDLRSIVADGVLFSVMVGLGESYVPAFALALGFGAVAAGLLTTLPMLVGAVFQLTTPAGVRWLGSYRRWVVLCARLQALSFVPLVLAAVLGDVGIVWVAGASIAYWGFGMATGPAWNAWVTTLVPAPERAKFFAHRTRISQAALMTALLSGAFLLEFGPAWQSERLLFAVLFVGAMLARFGSSHFLSRQSEQPGVATSHPRTPLRDIASGLRGGGAMRVLLYLLGLQAATNLASPFFTPFLLGPLALSYGEFMTLTAAAFLARIAVLPWLGRVAARQGSHRVMWFGGMGIVPLPILWLGPNDFLYLLAVQLLAGAAWGAVEYATILSFFERIDERIRAAVLTAFNLANALVISLASLGAAWLFTALEGDRQAYLTLFVVSAVARGAILLAIPRAESAAPIEHVISLRTLAVRPTAGAVQRPILAELDAEPSEDVSRANP